MKAIILAGGKATRLGEISAHVPKALIKIGAKPFVYYQLNFLKTQGIHNVVFCLGHLAEQVQKELKDGRDYRMKIEYSLEKEPLGTGGALIHAASHFEETTLVLNGDTFISFNLSEMLFFHKQKKADFTVGMVQVDSADISYNRMLVDQGGKVVGFEKINSDRSNFMSAGVYLTGRKLFEECLSKDSKVSLEDAVIPRWVHSADVDIYGYNIQGARFYDIGTPERIDVFRRYLEKEGELC